MLKKPNGDSTRPEVKLAQARRGIDVLGNYGIPAVIPSKIQEKVVDETVFRKAYDDAKGKIPQVVQSIRETNTKEPNGKETESFERE